MFPKYSWPWTVARESVFVLASQGRYLGAELQRLAESEHTGPIGSLVISRLLTYVDEKTSRQFALRGLTRMTADDFMADCKLFLSGGGGLAQSFRRIAGRLKALPEAELQALCSVLPSPEGTLVRKCAAAMRSDPAQPLNVVLGPALREYWTTALRQQVREELQRLASPKLEKSQVSVPGKRAGGAKGPA
jgi:hypothetical protein